MTDPIKADLQSAVTAASFAKMLASKLMMFPFQPRPEDDPNEYYKCLEVSFAHAIVRELQAANYLGATPQSASQPDLEKLAGDTLTDVTATIIDKFDGLISSAHASDLCLKYILQALSSVYIAGMADGSAEKCAYYYRRGVANVEQNQKLRDALERVGNECELMAYSSAGDPSRRDGMMWFAKTAGEIKHVLASHPVTTPKPEEA